MWGIRFDRLPLPLLLLLQTTSHRARARAKANEEQRNSWILKWQRTTWRSWPLALLLLGLLPDCPPVRLPATLMPINMRHTHSYTHSHVHPHPHTDSKQHWSRLTTVLIFNSNVIYAQITFATFPSHSGQVSACCPLPRCPLPPTISWSKLYYQV